MQEYVAPYPSGPARRSAEGGASFDNGFREKDIGDQHEIRDHPLGGILKNKQVGDVVRLDCVDHGVIASVNDLLLAPYFRALQLEPLIALGANEIDCGSVRRGRS